MLEIYTLYPVFDTMCYMPYVSCIQQVSSGPVTAAAVKKERIKYKNKKDKEKKEKRKKVNGKGKLKTGRSIRTAQ